MKYVVIIQARMGSTRLPGKVLKKLVDKTVLAHVIERTKAFPHIDEIIVATTSKSDDDSIVEEAKRWDVTVYRGSETDVLARYYEAAKKAKADAVIRITSDCPLLDPDVSTRVINAYRATEEFDYVSNTLERSYPRGLDIEVFSFASLQIAFREASASHHREHVTPYIYENQNRFFCHSVVSERDYSSYRWTLDTLEDWNLIERIYLSLYQPGKLFSWREVVTLLEQNPEWVSINSHIVQKSK